MSQAINLCEDSDDNGELLNANAASISLLLLSRKRPRDKEEASNHAHPRNENDPGNKTATGSADFVVGLELAEEGVEVSVKRRDVKNDAAGHCAQIMKGVEATERDVSISEDAQVAAHRESHQSIITAAAASHPMSPDSKQTIQNVGSTNMHSKKPSTSEPPSNESGRQSRVSAWEDSAWVDLLSELANYRRIHGHCNVPMSYSSERTKLANWVTNQRKQYKFHLEGKPTSMTLSRIQALESLAFAWDCYGATWEVRLSELADYRRIHGHCNVPQRCSGNVKLANWVKTQRKQYRLHLEGKKSHLTAFRIQELEDLGF
jgi:hypothetical protein